MSETKTWFDFISQTDITDQESEAMMLSSLIRLAALCRNLRMLKGKDHTSKQRRVQYEKMIDETVNTIDAIVASVGMLKFEEHNKLGIIQKDEDGNVKVETALLTVNKIASSATDKIIESFKKEGLGGNMEEKNNNV